MRYAVVLPARNEEKYIRKTLSALRRQTVLSDQIIVVDDGSNDSTAEIASEYADVVIRLSDRGYSVLCRPVLAEVINQGLRRVEKDMDYVLICGADNVVPPEFFEVLSKRMKANPKLVIASGRCKGEPYNKNHPRGTRVVDANFWRRANGLLYPVVPGWESWLCFKAAQLGYEVRAFRDVVTEPQRPTKSVYVSVATARSRGESMYALGYDWIYALGRCVITFLKNPRAGLSMFLGWLLHKGVGRLDVADWVGQMQKESFWRRVRSIIKRGGRK